MVAARRYIPGKRLEVADGRSPEEALAASRGEGQGKYRINNIDEDNGGRGRGVLGCDLRGLRPASVAAEHSPSIKKAPASSEKGPLTCLEKGRGSAPWEGREHRRATLKALHKVQHERCATPAG